MGQWWRWRDAHSMDGSVPTLGCAPAEPCCAVDSTRQDKAKTNDVETQSPACQPQNNLSLSAVPVISYHKHHPIERPIELMIPFSSPEDAAVEHAAENDSLKFFGSTSANGKGPRPSSQQIVK